LALAWLLLRSGTKPSRMAYPCQQAAFSTAALVFGATFVGAVVALRRRLSVAWLTPVGISLGAVGLIAATGVWSQLQLADSAILSMTPPPGYRAQVFHQAGCPADPLGDRFLCVEDLIEMLGTHGIKLHRSPTTSLTAGPGGIIGPDDVVLIKINYQWPERGGTNTDLLRGLIRRIVAHPEGFTGEIVVCENTQFQSPDGYDRHDNNAQVPSLSPHDVVGHFAAEGHRISHQNWSAIRYQSVDEYSTGDLDDGYVVFPYDSGLQGRISYPKFETGYGTRISLKEGVWDAGAGYDRERLKLVNLPVLKSHHAVYGATALVKNYMGVVTRELSTDSHNAIRYGILGAAMAEFGPADLNILDAIWINADPYDGPWTSYSAATRADQLVASLDPIAADRWAVKNILLPAFAENGYSPPWPNPSADPDDPESAFRRYLDASMDRLLAAGHEVTNDPAQVDVIDLGPPGEVSEPGLGGAPFTIERHAQGYELAWSAPARGGPVEEYELYRVPLDGLATGSLPECDTLLGTGTSALVANLPDGHGFLMAGWNPAGNSSLGRDGRGHDRPAAENGGVCP
jgi:hypothetical protein